MTTPEVRDWPVWKWTLVIAATFLGGGVLQVVGEWAKQYLGPNAPFILWAALGGAALGLFLRHRLDRDDRTTKRAESRGEGGSRVEERERRMKLGFLLAWALVGVIGVVIDGGIRETMEAARSIREADWPIVAMMLVHIVLLVLGMAISLSDNWPVYVVVALAAIGLTTLYIPDPNLSLGAAALLLMTGALLLTFRSRKASLWFCGIVGGEWFLWTTMMNGADTYDPVHGLVGVLFAGVTAFLAWQFGPRLETA